tara:strand:+ start:78 stop:818 length:741 start_codon:yes stop_codon:yes gene_type:complete
MSIVVDLMKRRQNVRFFTEQEPDKKLIDTILRQAHELTPHKNNIFRYRVNVFGPEFAEDKKKLVLLTCTKRKIMIRHRPLTDKYLKQVEKIYNEWFQIGKHNEINEYAFLPQVTAPYLLAYTYDTTKQVSVTQKDKLQKYSMVEHARFFSETDWTIQASMHAFAVALLCAEQGLTASFCRCYFFDDKLKNKIMSSSHEKQTTLFYLGIGYRDDSKRYPSSSIPKLNYDEVIKWKEKHYDYMDEKQS